MNIWFHPCASVTKVSIFYFKTRSERRKSVSKLFELWHAFSKIRQIVTGNWKSILLREYFDGNFFWFRFFWFRPPRRANFWYCTWKNCPLRFFRAIVQKHRRKRLFFRLDLSPLTRKIRLPDFPSQNCLTRWFPEKNSHRSPKSANCAHFVSRALFGHRQFHLAPFRFPFLFPKRIRRSSRQSSFAPRIFAESLFQMLAD